MNKAHAASGSLRSSRQDLLLRITELAGESHGVELPGVFGSDRSLKQTDLAWNLAGPLRLCRPGGRSVGWAGGGPRAGYVFAAARRAQGDDARPGSGSGATLTAMLPFAAG